MISSANGAAITGHPQGKKKDPRYGLYIIYPI